MLFSFNTVQKAYIFLALIQVFRIKIIFHNVQYLHAIILIFITVFQH